MHIKKKIKKKEIPVIAAVPDPTVGSLMQKPAHPSKLGEGSRAAVEIARSLMVQKLIN